MSERVKEIRERLEKATPGPWCYGAGNSSVLCDVGIIDHKGFGILVNCGRSSGSETPEDGDFIAHSRTDVPDLLAALKQARENCRAAALNHMEQLEVLPLDLRWRCLKQFVADGFSCGPGEEAALKAAEKKGANDGD